MSDVTGFDFSDLELLTDIGTEVEVINPDADMESVVLPPEGKKYVVIPKLIAMKGTETHYTKPNKAGKLQFVGIDWKIEDPGKPWHGQSSRTWPSTSLNRAGTTEVDVLLRAYTGKAGVGQMDKVKVGALGKILLAGQPIKVDIQWEAQLRVQGEPEDTEQKDKLNFKVILRGMTKFPKLESGNYTAVESVDQLSEDLQKKVAEYMETYPDLTIESSWRVKNYYPMSVA
jgi:hypothetical protein